MFSSITHVSCLYYPYIYIYIYTHLNNPNNLGPKSYILPPKQQLSASDSLLLLSQKKARCEKPKGGKSPGSALNGS